jgi:hypothetical protein
VKHERSTRQIDAAHAAAVLRANGSDLPPGITEDAGYTALLHPDRDTALAWWRDIVETYGPTLIGLDTIEGGVLALYDLLPAPRLAPPEET